LKIEDGRITIEDGRWKMQIYRFLDNMEIIFCQKSTTKIVVITK